MSAMRYPQLDYRLCASYSARGSMGLQAVQHHRAIAGDVAGLRPGSQPSLANTRKIPMRGVLLCQANA
jgi:hypothetical protein